MHEIRRKDGCPKKENVKKQDQVPQAGAYTKSDGVEEVSAVRSGAGVASCLFFMRVLPRQAGNYGQGGLSICE